LIIGFNVTHGTFLAIWRNDENDELLMTAKAPAEGSPYIQVLSCWRTMDLGEKKKRYRTMRRKKNLRPG